MKTAVLKFSSLNTARLRQMRMWAVGCIAAILMLESFLGMILFQFIGNPANFEKTYSRENQHWSEKYETTKKQLASLLDLSGSAQKKPAPPSIVFHLFIDRFPKILPEKPEGIVVKKVQFHYKADYHYLFIPAVLRPPQISIYSLS